VLNGAGVGGDGLVITAGGSGSTVQALGINNVAGIGIHIQGSSNNVIIGNYLRTNDDGTAAQAYGPLGVELEGGSADNRIGANGDGTNDTIERNLISCNSSIGIVIQDAGTTGTIVAGNFIGTNAAGTAGIVNGGDGIRIINGAVGSRIGTDGSNDAFNASERN